MKKSGYIGITQIPNTYSQQNDTFCYDYLGKGVTLDGNIFYALWIVEKNAHAAFLTSKKNMFFSICGLQREGHQVFAISLTFLYLKASCLMWLKIRMVWTSVHLNMVCQCFVFFLSWKRDRNALYLIQIIKNFQYCQDTSSYKQPHLPTNVTWKRKVTHMCYMKIWISSVGFFFSSIIRLTQ